MRRPKCYSPQLSRDIVSRLYLKAKAEGIPMTRLASRLIEKALGPNQPTDIPITKENNGEAGAE